MEKEREGLSPKPPTLQMVVEPAVKGSALLAQRRRSTGMLNIVETPPTVKFKLGETIAIILITNAISGWFGQ